MVEAILQGTIRVLVTRGYEGTTTIAVAGRAGVSVGSLYQYFPNKESLVAALVERHSEEIIACIDAALENIGHLGPRHAVEALIRAAMNAHRIDPALHKVLSEQAPRIGRIKVAMDTSKVITERLARYLSNHRAALRGRDPEIAAFIVETAVEAITHRSVIDSPGAMPDARIEAEATDLVLRYLFGPRVSAHDSASGKIPRRHRERTRDGRG
jgi:AcrR family transcriptional regulator